MTCPMLRPARLIAAGWLLALAAPAFAQSWLDRDARVTPLAKPDDVAYWVHDETDERVEWGAVGVEIDQWDTREHGLWHDQLLWYRFRLLYPDGRVFAEGYDWIERDSEDATIRPGRWATHNWPVASAESLLPYAFTAVATSPDDPRTDSDVGAYTRWYPAPPRISGTSAGSPWAAYADGRVGLRASASPLAASRRAQAVLAYIEHTNRWDTYWGRVQVDAVRDGQAQIDMARLAAAAGESLAVDYIDDLRDRLGPDDRYQGSLVDTFPDELKNDAARIFAAVEASDELATSPPAGSQASRIPSRLFGAAPTVNPRPRVHAQEMAAALARRLTPLPNPAESVHRVNARAIDPHLGLWSSGQRGAGDPRQRGPWSGAASGSGVMLVSAEQEATVARLAIAEVERGARTIEALTGFAQVSPAGDVLRAEPLAAMPAAFALVSDTRTAANAAIVRTYDAPSGSVDVAELLRADLVDDADALQPADAQENGATLRLTVDATAWRSLADAVASATGREADGLRMPLPARRASATAAWTDYLNARARD